ncbi:hypothetical protein [Phyllobacterium chamaecytisi]|uniref:hypothetical protein n=1 Tax=Phyllobacterium chamaecytisi TaxID=2876082 RepID=UPI001CCE86CA|nr:hypothetical protein [Phyllobacterium sp. KW56]MBZ9602607.1 hypothetical protein [Phyllobacterium sp. KW56]
MDNNDCPFEPGTLDHIPRVTSGPRTDDKPMAAQVAKGNADMILDMPRLLQQRKHFFNCWKMSVNAKKRAAHFQCLQNVNSLIAEIEAQGHVAE